jgi:hypothetical protein
MPDFLSQNGIACKSFVLLVPVLAGIALAQGVATRNAEPAQRAKASGKAFPVTFESVAGAFPMDFVSGGIQEKRFIIEANGTGVALIDLDGDGDLDAYLVNGQRLTPVPEAISRLYRNRLSETGTAAFEDVTAASGTGFSGWGNGVCAGDADGDGRPDLYVTYWGPNRLYRNLGGLKFEEVAAKMGVAGPQTEWSTGCTFLDYDRDGHQDLFVTSYQQFDLKTAPLPGKASNCEWKGMPVFCGPRGLPYGRVTLYRNTGAGRFEDVTEKSGVGRAAGFYAFTAVAADLNGDGWTDIYVASDSTPSLLFRNNRNGTFSEIATETGVAYSEHGFEQGGMGVAVGDINRDGLLDVVKTNFAGDYPNVYTNTGGGIFEDAVVRSGLAVNPQMVGWGVALADLDLDGWPDVFQVNGHVYPELESRKGAEQYRQPRLVYRNLGGGKLEDVSALAGAAIAERRSSRGAAFGDYDNDGDIDVLVMNMNEAPSLLRNNLKTDSGWISLDLGVAIGATATVETTDGKQTQVALSQSSFLSQSDLRLHFGLGAARSAKVRVRWPDGRDQDFGVLEGRRVHRLRP